MSSSIGPRMMFVPDPQVKPGVRIDHLRWAARYARDKRIPYIGFGGDFDDFSSLSSYDKGKLESHGKFFEDDVEAGNKARDAFFGELRKLKTYDPLIWITLGNHEERVLRAASEDPKMAKTFTLDKLNWKKHGVRVYPFLQPVSVQGVTFVHYCALNDNGQVTNGKNGCSAAAQARRFMRSTVSGHRQGIDIAYRYSPGKTIVSVVAGSFYQHEERYLTAQGKTYWRGVVTLNDVRNGHFDPMPVSMRFLRARYG